MVFNDSRSYSHISVERSVSDLHWIFRVTHLASIPRATKLMIFLITCAYLHFISRKFLIFCSYYRISTKNLVQTTKSTNCTDTRYILEDDDDDEKSRFQSPFYLVLFDTTLHFFLILPFNFLYCICSIVQ